MKKDCFNIGKYNSHCKYYGHYQQGGGTTSPDYSYIFCKFSNQKVKMIPDIPPRGMRRSEIKIELPDKCCLNQNKEGQLKINF